MDINRDSTVLFTFRSVCISYPTLATNCFFFFMLDNLFIENFQCDHRVVATTSVSKVTFIIWKYFYLQKKLSENYIFATNYIFVNTKKIDIFFEAVNFIRWKFVRR